MPAIAIGSAAINRNSTTSVLITYLDKNNPATDTGFITQVILWFNTAATGVRVGTFYLVSGTTYKCRDSVAIGAVAAGSALPFAVMLAVVTGDFIGLYTTTGKLERSTDVTPTGGMYRNGEYIDPGDQGVYTAFSPAALSISGTGVTPVVITTAALPDGTVGAAYSEACAADAGTPPYTWSLDSGDLPDGLVLGADGVIDGIPTVAGVFNFVVKVTDSSPTPLTDTQALTITIIDIPPPPVLVLVGTCEDKATAEIEEWRKALLIGGVPANNPALFCPAIHGHGVTLLDRSPFANNGAITGATWAHTARGHHCLSFNGAGNSIECLDSASLDIITALTMVAWIRSANVLTHQILIRKKVAYEMTTEIVTGRLTFYSGNGAAWTVQTIGVLNVCDGTWHQVMATYDDAANTVNLYVDGVLDKTGADATVIGVNANNLYIGSSEGGAPWFAGQMAMQQIYPSVLPAAERTRLFTRQRRLFGV